MPRRRINLSVSSAEHDILESVRRAYGFASICELITALIHVFVDRIDSDKRQISMPDDDAEYIDGMFDSLARSEPTPDSDMVPKHRKSGNIYRGNGNGKGR